MLQGGDVAMLEDLIVAAVNQATRAAQQQMADAMSALTGGLKIPGLELMNEERGIRNEERGIRLEPRSSCLVPSS